MTTDQPAVMQLAFRSEGHLLNAYIERAGAEPFIELVGSINAHVCDGDSELMQTWRLLMSLTVARLAERLSGAPVQLSNLRQLSPGGCA